MCLHRTEGARIVEPMNRNQFMLNLVRRFGPSMQEFGARFGITKQAVRVWVQRGVVPAERCHKVSDALGVPLWDLNPTIYRRPK